MWSGRREAGRGRRGTRARKGEEEEEEGISKEVKEEVEARKREIKEEGEKQAVVALAKERGGQRNGGNGKEKKMDGKKKKKEKANGRKERSRITRNPKEGEWGKETRGVSERKAGRIRGRKEE